MLVTLVPTGQLDEHHVAELSWGEGGDADAGAIASTFAHSCSWCT